MSWKISEEEKEPPLKIIWIFREETKSRIQRYKLRFIGIQTSANLSSRHEQLVKGSITEMTYDEINTKLTKIYSQCPSGASRSISIDVKIEEPIFHSSSNGKYDEGILPEEFAEYDADIPDSDQSDIETYYTNYRDFREKNFNLTKNIPAWY